MFWNLHVAAAVTYDEPVDMARKDIITTHSLCFRFSFLFTLEFCNSLRCACTDFFTTLYLYSFASSYILMHEIRSNTCTTHEGWTWKWHCWHRTCVRRKPMTVTWLGISITPGRMWWLQFGTIYCTGTKMFFFFF
jgi:hypothetical protein